jgi:succinate dehydrogenase hydrophobic anchor subunit
MPFSLFVLALYVFLKESPVLGWFTVDPKLTAVVGILFVVVVVFDAAFWVRTSHPAWFARRNPPTA